MANIVSYINRYASIPMSEMPYNDIDMTTLTTGALTFYRPTQQNGEWIQGIVGLEINSDGLDLDRFNLVSTFDTVFGYYKLFLRNQLRCFNVDISNNLLHPVSEHDIEEVCKTVAKDLGYR